MKTKTKTKTEASGERCAQPEECGYEGRPRGQVSSPCHAHLGQHSWKWWLELPMLSTVLLQSLSASTSLPLLRTWGWMHSNFYKYTCEVLTSRVLTEQPAQSCKGWVLLPFLVCGSGQAFLPSLALVYKVGVIIVALLTHRILEVMNSKPFVLQVKQQLGRDLQRSDTWPEVEPGIKSSLPDFQFIQM